MSRSWRRGKWLSCMEKLRARGRPVNQKGLIPLVNSLLTDTPCHGILPVPAGQISRKPKGRLSALRTVACNHSAHDQVFINQIIKAHSMKRFVVNVTPLITPHVFCGFARDSCSATRFLRLCTRFLLRHTFFAAWHEVPAPPHVFCGLHEVPAPEEQHVYSPRFLMYTAPLGAACNFAREILHRLRSRLAKVFIINSREDKR
jgi:hypothetical protein